MLRKIIFCLMPWSFSVMLYGQVKDSISSTFLVAHYDYTCRTSDNKGENHIVNYGLTLQVAQDMALSLIHI